MPCIERIKSGVVYSFVRVTPERSYPPMYVHDAEFGWILTMILDIAYTRPGGDRFSSMSVEVTS